MAVAARWLDIVERVKGPRVERRTVARVDGLCLEGRSPEELLEGVLLGRNLAAQGVVRNIFGSDLPGTALGVDIVWPVALFALGADVVQILDAIIVCSVVNAVSLRHLDAIYSLRLIVWSSEILLWTSTGNEC